jgi:hypothetical protein
MRKIQKKSHNRNKSNVSRQVSVNFLRYIVPILTTNKFPKYILFYCKVVSTFYENLHLFLNLSSLIFVETFFKKSPFEIVIYFTTYSSLVFGAARFLFRSSFRSFIVNLSLICLNLKS